MKLLRPKNISTLPAPDITGNLHGNHSKHEISLLNWQLRFLCGPQRENKVKQRRKKQILLVFFFLQVRFWKKNFAVSWSMTLEIQVN